MPLTQLDDQTALVTVDFQNFLQALPLLDPLDRVVAAAVRLAAAFRAAGLPVVHVRASFSPDFGDVLQPRADAPLHLPELQEGWDQYLDELQVKPTDLLVTKRQFGAFYGTDLDLQLRRRKITGIVLAGVATSVGVEATARAATEYGYEIVVATDAVTDTNAASHEDALENTFPLFCELDTADAVIARLGELN